MTWITVSSFFYAFVLLHIVALSEAAWLPRAGVLRRQAGLPPAVPSQCQSVCTPAFAALQACTPPSVSCLCPQSLQDGLFNCFTCVGTAGNATDYSAPQMEIDEITVACDQAGMPLPKRTFPGQDPNRSLPTSTTGAVPTSTHGSSSPITASTVQSTKLPSPITTQTAPTLPLSTGTPISTAVSASHTSTTSAPTTSSTNNASKDILSLWTVATAALMLPAMLLISF